MPERRELSMVTIAGPIAIVHAKVEPDATKEQIRDSLRETALAHKPPVILDPDVLDMTGMPKGLIKIPERLREEKDGNKLLAVGTGRIPRTNL